VKVESEDSLRQLPQKQGDKMRMTIEEIREEYEDFPASSLLAEDDWEEEANFQIHKIEYEEGKEYWDTEGGEWTEDIQKAAQEGKDIFLITDDDNTVDIGYVLKK